MPDVLADLESIPDDPKDLYYVKQCFRALQTRLGVLEQAQAQPKTDAELKTAIAALEARVGVLERTPDPTIPTVPDPLTCCRVKRASNQSIPDSVWTAVAFTGEVYDFGGFHDNVTNNGRLTAPATGVYRIGAEIEWAAVAAAGHLGIWRAGSENGGLGILIARDYTSAMGTVPYLQVDVDYELAAGEWVEIRAFQGSGAPNNVVYQAAHDDGSGGYTPTAWIHLVRLT